MLRRDSASRKQKWYALLIRIRSKMYYLQCLWNAWHMFIGMKNERKNNNKKKRRKKLSQILLGVLITELIQFFGREIWSHFVVEVCYIRRENWSTWNKHRPTAINWQIYIIQLYRVQLGTGWNRKHKFEQWQVQRTYQDNNTQACTCHALFYFEADMYTYKWVCEWLLFNANLAIVQIYHGDKMLYLTPSSLCSYSLMMCAYRGKQQISIVFLYFGTAEVRIHDLPRSSLHHRCV